MLPHLFAMLARSSAGVRCMQRMSVVSTVWDDAFERSVTPLQRRAALLSLVRKIASANPFLALPLVYLASLVFRVGYSHDSTTRLLSCLAGSHCVNQAGLRVHAVPVPWLPLAYGRAGAKC